MNLHNHEEMELFDISLKQQLKKAVAQKQPPPGGKARLLKAASQKTASNVTEISILLYMALSDNYYDKLSIERVKGVTSLTSLAGALGVL